MYMLNDVLFHTLSSHCNIHYTVCTTQCVFWTKPVITVSLLIIFHIHYQLLISNQHWQRKFVCVWSRLQNVLPAEVSRWGVQDHAAMLGVQAWESAQIRWHSERTGSGQEKIAFNEEMAGRPNSYFTSRWSLICREKHDKCFALEITCYYCTKEYSVT